MGYGKHAHFIVLGSIAPVRGQTMLWVGDRDALLACHTGTGFSTAVDHNAWCHRQTACRKGCRIGGALTELGAVASRGLTVPGHACIDASGPDAAFAPVFEPKLR